MHRVRWYIVHHGIGGITPVGGAHGVHGTGMITTTITTIIIGTGQVIIAEAIITVYSSNTGSIETG